MNSDGGNQQPERSLPQIVPEAHLRDYIAIVLQHTKLVAAIVVACLVLGMLKVWSAKPEYKATALIRVRQRQGPEEVAGNYASYASWEKELSSYCHIIKGSDLARTLARKLGARSYEDLGLSEPRPGLPARAKNWIVEHIPTSRTQGASGADEKVEPARFAGPLQARIDARVLRETNLIQITYTAQQAERASEICQLLVGLFIQTEQERRLNSAKRWLRWFREQQADLEKKVADSEGELVAFHKKVDAYVGTVEGGTKEGLAGLQNTIGTLQSRQAAVRVQRIALATQLKMLEDLGSKGNPIPANLALLDNLNIARLLQKRGDLRRESAVKQMRYGPKHPEITELRKSMSLLEEDINTEAEQALETLRARLKGVVIEEDRLGKEIKTAEDKAAEISKKTIEYNALKRKAEVNWRFFDTILGKAKEADLAASIDSVNIDLITEEPDVSRAATHAVRTMVFALLLGLALGIGLALFADYMDTSLATPADVERSLDLEQLAVLVHAGYRRPDKRAPVLAAKDHPDSILAENLRTLRASVLFSPQFQGIRFIVVSSSMAGEGKTTVAANLAVVLAQAGKKALLVDGDMRKPALHRLFGINRAPGLSDFLKGRKALEDVLNQCGIENLSVIACGTSTSNPAELIGTASERIEKLTEVGNQFDYVIFDTPPLTLSDPTLLLKSVGGSALLVIRSGAVSEDMVRRSVQKLRSVDVHVAGAVLNNFDVRKRGYYGYGYRYYNYIYRHYRYQSDEAKKQGAREESAE